MYGPIANLPGYNPNATYLPPGMAAPSSYPERTAPRQQFYDMAPLPSVVDQSITDLASGISSSDPRDSFFGESGIAGGIGGNAGGVDAMYGFKFPNNGSMDGLEYAFLNNFLASNAQQPQQNWDNFTGGLPPEFFENYGTSAPNFTGPSNDQFSGDWNTAQPETWPNLTGPSGNGYSGNYTPTQSDFPLSPFNIQPGSLNQSQLDYLSQLPALQSQGIGAGWNTAANLAGLALPGFGGMALNALYGLGTGLAGETLTSDPDKSFLGRMLDPREPGLIASGLNYAGRAINDMLSPAERSAEDAYGRSDVYNKDGSGWQMGAPAYSATPVDNTWSGNNPAAWGFNAEPWAGDFGAGRYDAGFTPSEWQINQGIIDNWAPQTYQLPMSPIMPIDPGASWFAPPELGNWADDELPMFGPGGRYGTGRWSTD